MSHLGDSRTSLFRGWAAKHRDQTGFIFGVLLEALGRLYGGCSRMHREAESSSQYVR